MKEFVIAAGVIGFMLLATVIRNRSRQQQLEMERTQFSWKHYTKPTPKNLMGLAAAMRRLVAVVAGTSIVLEANMWVSLGIIMLGALLDEFKNFFAMVDDDIRTETAEAEMPSGDVITVTQTIHEPPKDEA